RVETLERAAHDAPSGLVPPGGICRRDRTRSHRVRDHQLEAVRVAPALRLRQRGGDLHPQPCRTEPATVSDVVCREGNDTAALELGHAGHSGAPPVAGSPRSLLCRSSRAVQLHAVAVVWGVHRSRRVVVYALRAAELADDHGRLRPPAVASGSPYGTL